MTQTANPTTWRPSAPQVFGWALVIGVLMSTQFLFQTFVWRNWPLDEVLLGWLDVVRDTTIVALSIGAALLAFGRLPERSAAAHALRVGGAIVVGAALGQLLLIALDSPGATGGWPSLVGRVLRWSVVGGSVAAIYYLWRRSSEAGAAAREAELQRAQVERQTVQARLAALRSQIEPHFLFNTLATVRRLHHTEPAGGAQLLADFLDYLRLTLPKRQGEHERLGDELDLVAAYLGVVGVRMSGRLDVSWQVEAPLRDCAFPPLMLATLVENAIKHGIAPAPQGGALQLTARRDAASLEVTVADTGVGFCGHAGSGIGLANIRARLQTLYGDSAALALEAVQPSGVKASLRLPYRLCGAAA